MTENQILLWEKIKSFEIDDIDSSFYFTDRLVRENNWSTEFALRAILEYKKFIFLIIISDTSQSPSEAVDQVWHLHLLYTQSYWVEFCKNTLNKDIHHGPTKGVEQKAALKDQYIATVAFYKLIFNAAPPKDIWPTVDKVFKKKNYTWVNRNKYWIIAKIKFNNP